jgi:two-component system response regulator HydG
MTMIAYLVVREGTKWRDVHRLTSGQVITIGRAAGNRIVVHDEMASRHHVEIFQSGLVWTLRDLGSRNGTLVDGKTAVGDVGLETGSIITVGETLIAFTYDLQETLPKLEERTFLDGETGVDIKLPDSKKTPISEPEIVERKKSTRFEEGATSAEFSRDRTSQELAKLYKLAMEMGTAHEPRRLAEIVLAGLFDSTPADIGAILLLPPDVVDPIDPSKLTLLVYKSKNRVPYEKISEYLSRTVLSTREAVRAKCVSEDPVLFERDSLGKIQAQTVICAPLRVNDKLYGLVHLYSTNHSNPLEADDVEFTLAVADQCGVALEGLRRQEQLAAGLARMQDDLHTLREQLGIESELVGSSPPMEEINRKIGRIAPTDATVLVRGESGVGKELVARAIHFSSRRRTGPFVCLNCAALTESLLESELFGHEKGSFTGAVARKAGKFEQAHSGTLMLDEVGEMSLNIQAKFLRVLEGHPYERVGGGISVEADVRVVAATNRDLEQAVTQGTFRKDLYFRLHVVEIMVPPLREHRSDIPILANHFLERFSRKSGRSVRGFTSAALELLTDYDWPGNVRELQHVVERAVIMSVGEYVGDQDIQMSSLGGSSSDSGAFSAGSGISFRELTLESLEQEYIMATLDRTAWNKSQAAQILGIERSTLDRKLKRYQVERPKK